MIIARLCKEFNCLPYNGGLLQQPRGAVLRLEAVMDASDRYEKLENDRNNAGKDK